MDAEAAAAHRSRASRDIRAQRRARLGALAAAPHGQVHRDDLAASGYDADARRRLVAAGTLVPRHAGVFALAGSAPGLHADAMAAVLAGGPGALLCCLAGAALFGAGRLPQGPLCVSVPRETRRPRADVRFHERTRMPRADRHFGVPVCRPEQVVLDCASLLDRDALDRLVDDLVADRRVTMAQLDACAAANGGVPGVVALRGTLDLVRHGITRSRAEQLLRRALATSAVGPFVLNAEVLGRCRDAWLPDARAVVEVQTLRFHGTPARMDDDARRALELQAAGIEPVAVTARMLRDDPRSFVAALEQVVARRRR